jgi:hypothetical protein
LGSRAPKGRVPLIRPRRDRIMGSSILASLSEAGGNDPCYPVNGPLPPHSLDGADRVGTRPTHLLMQAVFQSFLASSNTLPPLFQPLAPFSFLLSIFHRTDSGITVPVWLAPPFPISFPLSHLYVAPSATIFIAPLFPAPVCLIMVSVFISACPNHSSRCLRRWPAW